MTSIFCREQAATLLRSIWQSVLLYYAPYLYKHPRMKEKIEAKHAMHVMFLKSREANEVSSMEIFAIR